MLLRGELNSLEFHSLCKFPGIARGEECKSRQNGKPDILNTECFVFQFNTLQSDPGTAALLCKKSHTVVLFFSRIKFKFLVEELNQRNYRQQHLETSRPQCMFGYDMTSIQDMYACTCALCLVNPVHILEASNWCLHDISHHGTCHEGATTTLSCCVYDTNKEWNQVEAILIERQTHSPVFQRKLSFC